MTVILLILVLIPLSLYAMFPSFQLGLYGDDWLEIWRFFYALGPQSHGIWNYLTYFLSRYGSFDLIMGFLVQTVGYQSVYFYIVAYLLRLIASLSFYPMIYYFTKSKLSAFFAVLFFSVAAVGLDATNWVFNMPVYIAIAFLNFFFLFYTRSALENKMRPFFISLIFFTLAIVMASVRTTGLVPFVILMELFWFFQVRNYKKIRQLTTRILIFLALFILIVLIGQFAAIYGDRKGSELVGTFNDLFGTWTGGFLAGGNLLTQGRLNFVAYPLIIIGNMILPIDSAYVKQLIFIILGCTLLIIGLKLILSNYKNRLISSGLFLSLNWLFFSFFLAWLKDPQTILPFSHRYLIVSAMALTILFSQVISLGKNLSQKKDFFLLFSLLILVNVYSSRNYLQYQVDNLHGAQTTEKIWSKMPYIPEITKHVQPLVFYFVGENKQIMYGAITFGFPVHVALLYKLDDFSKMPIPMDDWNNVVSAVTNGKSLIPFGFPIKPIPIENIYAFKLEGDDNLLNITDQIRKRLLKFKESSI